MKNRRDELLGKYWKGESSLEEEKELRQILSVSDDPSPERRLFLGFQELSNLDNPGLVHPKHKRKPIHTWARWAALLIAFLTLSWITYQHVQTTAERKAFEQVMQAFSMIQENMEKGTKELSIMEEFRHLNKPNEVFPLIEKHHE